MARSAPRRDRPGRRRAPRGRASPRDRRSRCGSGAGSSGLRSRRASARARSGSGPHRLLHLPQPPVAVDVGERRHRERRSRRGSTMPTSTVASQPMTAMPTSPSSSGTGRRREGTSRPAAARATSSTDADETADHTPTPLLVRDAQLGEHLEHRLHRPVDRGGDRSARGRCPPRSPRARSLRRAPDRPGRPATASMPSTTAGFIEWASMSRSAVRRRRAAVADRAVQLRLDDGDGAGRLAHRHGVDEDEGVVAVEQLVGEVDAADAEVGDPDAVGQRHGRPGGWPPRPRSRRRRGRCCRCRRRAPSGRRHASTSTSSGWKYR